LRDVASSLDERLGDRAVLRFDVTHAPTTTAMDLLHRRLFHAAQKRSETGLALEETSLELVGHVLAFVHGIPDGARPRSTEAQRRHRDAVEHTKEVLAARVHESLGLDDLAAEVGCSLFHLSRVFRRETGLPIHRYQTRLRVRTALARILEGERNLTSLAIELGFSDHAHFTNTFRRALGFPPSRGRDLPAMKTIARASKNLQA
jgi:AraC-like DNA-binding protein